MARWIVRLLAIASLVAAASACTQLVDAPTLDQGTIVVTAGSEAPDALGGGTIRPLSNLKDAIPSLGGSSTAPVSIVGQGCAVDDYAPISLNITFSLSGNQRSPASFDVYTLWIYDGTTFNGSGAVTVNSPVVMGDGTKSVEVSISVQNPLVLGDGATTIMVEPFNLVTNSGDPGGLQLKIDASSTATIYVQFEACESANTKPYLTVSPNLTVEATSSDGAAVDFVVLAGDNEDGDLDPTCKAGDTVVTGGEQFPIGETEVTCSVTDSGGLSTTGSFFIYVQDTMAPAFTAFPADTTVVATDINGFTLALSAFDIAASDHGPLGAAGGEVSPPVAIACTIGTDPADGFQLAIGQTATVTCVASDSASYRAPVGDGETAPAAPNASETAEFTVTVTLDVSDACGFEPPLRMEAPYSAHKTNSTIPHKFCPPAYDGGTPATELASGLRLVLNMVGSVPASDAIEANDFAAGSTQWRLADGRYIFNLKTDRAWAAGQYESTVSYNGVVLANTEFALRK